MYFDAMFCGWNNDTKKIIHNNQIGDTEDLSKKYKNTVPKEMVNNILINIYIYIYILECKHLVFF